MRISDWSSDVCSSDLIVPFPESSLNDEAGKLFMESYDEYARRARLMTQVHAMAGRAVAAAGDDESSECKSSADGASASSGDRKSGVEGKRGAVRVSHGGRRSSKKKTKSS